MNGRMDDECFGLLETIFKRQLGQLRLRGKQGDDRALVMGFGQFLAIEATDRGPVPWTPCGPPRCFDDRLGS